MEGLLSLLLREGGLGVGLLTCWGRGAGKGYTERDGDGSHAQKATLGKGSEVERMKCGPTVGGTERS